MKKITVLCSILFVMLLGCALPASAADVALYDERHALLTEECEECLSRLWEASEYTGMNIGVILGGKARSESSIEILADTYFDERFGKRADGILYYLDLSGQEDTYDYISTSGMGQFYYADGSMDDRVEEIFQELDKYLYPKGDEEVYDAVMAFAGLTEKYYDEGIPEGYYVYDDLDKCYYVVQNGEIVPREFKPLNWAGGVVGAFLGLMMGALAAVIVFFVVRSRYRFKSSLSPTSYVNRRNVQYHRQYDNFIRTYTTRVKIESSSGGHGGGGGGHSSGGHGGGGHHR